MMSCSLNIGGTVITSEPVVKLPGVSIDKPLSFSNHITLLCQKDGRYVLSHMSNKLTAEAKLLLFRSFILSYFNYCPLIWHLCGLGDLKKMETVQRRALRFVFNDFHASCSDLSSRAGKPLLYVERLKAFVTEVFPMYSNVPPEYNTSILTTPTYLQNVLHHIMLEILNLWRYLLFRA